jgi:hypothetical protein
MSGAADEPGGASVLAVRCWMFIPRHPCPKGNFRHAILGIGMHDR